MFCHFTENRIYVHCTTIVCHKDVVSDIEPACTNYYYDKINKQIGCYHSSHCLPLELKLKHIMLCKDRVNNASYLYFCQQNVKTFSTHFSFFLITKILTLELRKLTKKEGIETQTWFCMYFIHTSITFHYRSL